MTEYESGWSDIKNNTSYPFENYNTLPTNVILGISIISPKRYYLKQVQSLGVGVVLHLYTDEDDPLGVCNVVTLSPGYYKIEDASNQTIGYVEIGVGITLFNSIYLNYDYSFRETSFLFSTTSPITVQQSIQSQTGNITVKEGFNMSVSVENNAVTFSPEAGGGLGQFCGQPLLTDAVYNINSIIPDDRGNIEWVQAGQFLLFPDPSSNTIFFNLIIPEDRLSCTRTAFKGSSGFQGPQGIKGVDGRNTLPVCPTCETCDVSDICCECDVVDDFCGEGDVF